MNGRTVTYRPMRFLGVRLNPLALRERYPERPPVRALVCVVVIPEKRPNGVRGLLCVVMRDAAGSRC